MLMHAVDSYLAVRRAAGFALTTIEGYLRQFARFAGGRGETYVVTRTAIAWATLAPSEAQRAYQQLLRSSRRNVSPVKLIDGPFLMGHEDLSGALIECREIAKTSSRTHGVLHHAPEAFDRIEMVATVGR